MRGLNLKEAIQSRRMSKRYQLIKILCLLGCTVPSLCIAAEENTAAPEPGAGDLTCGPRCVRFLLRHYKLGEPEVIDLVREMQWPEIEKGSSLASVARALQKRGIHTEALQIHRDSVLVWPHPVIVHTEPNKKENAEGEAGYENVEEAGIGHYSVWMPSSSPSEAHVWNFYSIGFLGKVSTKELSRQMSGIVLLTSPTPITSVKHAVRAGGILPRLRLVLAMLGAIAIAVVILKKSRISLTH